MKHRKGIRRSVWLPTLMILYLIGMTAYFAPSLIAGGEITRLVVVTIVELIIILLLFLFLRKKEQRDQQNDQ